MKQVLSSSALIFVLLVVVVLSLVNLLAIVRVGQQVQPVIKTVTRTQFVRVITPTVTATPSAAVRYLRK